MISLSSFRVKSDSQTPAWNFSFRFRLFTRSLTPKIDLSYSDEICVLKFYMVSLLELTFDYFVVDHSTKDVWTLFPRDHNRWSPNAWQYWMGKNPLTRKFSVIFPSTKSFLFCLYMVVISEKLWLKVDYKNQFLLGSSMLENVVFCSITWKQ